MFPVTGPKTAMRDAFFNFYGYENSAVRNLFINRIGRNTYKNNIVDPGGRPIIFGINFASKSETA